ncbi:MAG: hypothetical protein ABI647_12195 [Gemmatimonadota bacterium]
MGVPIAAAILRTEKDIAAAFRSANATSPEDAINVHPHAPLEVIAWRKMTRRAIIRPAPPDRFYLHEESWDRFVKVRRRMAMLMVGAAILFALGILLRQR